MANNTRETNANAINWLDEELAIVDKWRENKIFENF